MKSFITEGRRGGASRAETEDALKAYYRAHRPAADEAAVRAAATAAVDSARRLREANAKGAGVLCRDRVGAWRACVETAAFVALQARFMGARAWLLQAGVVAAVVALWLIGAVHVASDLYACLAGAAIAVCGLPELAASRMCGIVELERSCKRDARAVAAARMVVLACSNAIGIGAVAVVSAAAATQAGVLAALLHAFAPYCLTVAGCLAITRRAGGSTALAAAAGWGAAIMLGSYVLAAKTPVVYEQASVWVWALAAAAAAVWAACEVGAWLADAAASPRTLSFDASSIYR